VILSRTTAQQPSFADAVKKTATSERQQKIEEIKGKDKPSLYIKPKPGETLAQLRSSWVGAINPEKDKIRATIFTGKNTMIVQAETKEDINRIINKTGIKDKFQIEDKKKKKPSLSYIILNQS